MAKRKANDRPSNVQIEIEAARVAECDDDWDAYEWVEELGAAFDWDPSRQLAKQWPWNGDAEHVTSDIVDEYGSLSQHLDALDDVELPRVERDIQELEADPASLIAAIPELTPAELDQPEPPPVVADAIEKIAEVVGDEDGEP